MAFTIALAAMAGIPVLILLGHIQRKRRRRKEFLRHLEWVLRDTGA
jgi:thiamine pyrophosphate-dependent acetolactate synthase large subunit-like protein